VLGLEGQALSAIARNAWHPKEPVPDPALDLVCLNVFMGTYPVKCYLLRCPATGETAVVDTGATPEAIIQKAREMKVKPSKILLTHAHPDHAWGLDQLVREFQCPTWIDQREPRPGGEPGIPELDASAVQRVGLNRSFLTDIQDFVRDQVEDTVSIFYD